MIAMRPATIAGALALVAYAIEAGDDLMQDAQDHYVLLDLVSSALASHVPTKSPARSLDRRASVAPRRRGNWAGDIAGRDDFLIGRALYRFIQRDRTVMARKSLRMLPLELSA